MLDKRLVVIILISRVELDEEWKKIRFFIVVSVVNFNWNAECVGEGGTILLSAKDYFN